MDEVREHPAFTRAKALPEPLRSWFPHNPIQAADWKPMTIRHALAMKVVAVARTRVECAWAAYINAVPGWNHEQEEDTVLAYGEKLREDIARILFPQFEDVPYAH